MQKWRAWALATRPKTLTASIIPVVAGTALAYSTGAPIDWTIPVLALLVAFCIQIATNLINDALDFKKGADTAERLGPTRVTQSGLLSSEQVLAAGITLLVLALIFGLPLIFFGGVSIGVLLVVSLICAYIYTGGPFPLAYYGFGDLFVLLFFGLASTTAVFYLQTGFINLLPLLAGLQIGCLATVLIAINNLRDYQGDAKANKRTLAVRFGKRFSRYEITLLLLIPFILSLLWLALGYLSAALLPLLTFPIAIYLAYRISTTEPGKIYNKFLAVAALLHLSFGLLLTVGFLLTRIP